MDNFRDVAGATGYSASGGKMRRGVVFRSDVLDERSVDLAKLSQLRVSQIFDLRTSAEIEPRPDAEVPGAKYVRFNVIGDEDARDVFNPATLTNPAVARELLIEVNRLFVRGPGARTELGGVIRAVANDPGVLVFHCSAGKDRTGWVAAVIQLALGVSDDDVMYDYLLSNERSAATINAIADRAEAARGRDAGEAARALSSVFPEALQAALDEVDAQYGGLAGYLRDGLQVDDQTLDRLRNKLIES